MNPTLLFMGTPELARIVLEKIHLAQFEIVGVVAQPDKPSGRGQELHSPPVALFAKEHHLKLFQPTTLKDEHLVSELKSLKPDFIVVAAYGRLIPQTILDIPKIEILNVHPSLLPKYRGAAPINWALINGDTVTGVSIMKVILKMDAGPVYAQKEFVPDVKDTAGSLTLKLAHFGGDLLVETIRNIIDQNIQPSIQDETKVTVAPLLKKEQGHIDWNQQAITIHNLMRGLNPWPGTFSKLDGKILKIFSAEPSTQVFQTQPGTVCAVSSTGIVVSCQNSSLTITELQLEGKKRMPVSEFIKGVSLKPMETLFN